MTSTSIQFGFDPAVLEVVGVAEGELLKAYEDEGIDTYLCTGDLVGFV